METEELIDVLLIEDDIRLANLVKEYLEKHNLVITTEYNGAKGLKQAINHRYDIILLDIMLPEMNGIEVCQQIRQYSDVPIIILTARGEEADKVMGLEIGADDYISKPFSSRELLARIRSIIRRVRGKMGISREIITMGDLEMDPLSYSAKINKNTLELTSYEFTLLFEMVKRAGRVLTRDQLMQFVKGNAEESYDRSIDVHISKLRQKLGEFTKGVSRIKTVRGIGYQYIKEN